MIRFFLLGILRWRYEVVFIISGSSSSLFCATHVACEVCSVKLKLVLLGLDVTSKCRGMSVRFWERGRLLDLDVLQCDRDAPVVRSQMSMVAHFLGAVSRSPVNATGGGVGVDFIKTLNRSSSSKVGVQNLFDVKNLNLEKLLRKPSYGVMGGIEMFELLMSLFPPLAG